MMPTPSTGPGELWQIDPAKIVSSRDVALILRVLAAAYPVRLPLAAWNGLEHLIRRAT